MVEMKVSSLMVLGMLVVMVMVVVMIEVNVVCLWWRWLYWSHCVCA